MCLPDNRQAAVLPLLRLTIIFQQFVSCELQTRAVSHILWRMISRALQRSQAVIWHTGLVSFGKGPNALKAIQVGVWNLVSDRDNMSCPDPSSSKMVHEMLLQVLWGLRWQFQGPLCNESECRPVFLALTLMTLFTTQLTSCGVYRHVWWVFSPGYHIYRLHKCSNVWSKG